MIWQLFKNKNCTFKKNNIQDSNPRRKRHLEISVTRFGDILPLWYNFKSLGQFWSGLFSVCQNSNLFWQFNYAIGQFFIVVNGRILIKLWSHLVTLIVVKIMRKACVRFYKHFLKAFLCRNKKSNCLLRNCSLITSLPACQCDRIDRNFTNVVKKLSHWQFFNNISSICQHLELTAAISYAFGQIFNAANGQMLNNYFSHMVTLLPICLWGKQRYKHRQLLLLDIDAQEGTVIYWAKYWWRDSFIFSRF